MLGDVTSLPSRSVRNLQYTIYLRLNEESNGKSLPVIWTETRVPGVEQEVQEVAASIGIILCTRHLGTNDVTCQLQQTYCGTCLECSGCVGELRAHPARGKARGNETRVSVDAVAQHGARGKNCGPGAEWREQK